MGLGSYFQVMATLCAQSTHPNARLQSGINNLAIFINDALVAIESSVDVEKRID